MMKTRLKYIAMNGTYSLPPPDAWASDGLLGGGRHMVTVQSTVAGNDSSVLGSGSFDVANDAWKHCKDVSRDDARPPDVYELLSHSVGETQYAFPPKGVCVLMFFFCIDVRN